MSKQGLASGRERAFAIDELFFSRTDEKGIIEFGNGVFIKISGYEKSEMIGKPHNIIRHPAMPRAVFKLFWDTVKSGQPIVAYVQNMAKNGDHYWVLAAAFPVKGGYLSIRLKPTSDLFAKVQVLYADVLRYEKDNGMEAAGAELLRLLAENGFESYRDFMIHALFTELRARDNAVPRAADARTAIEKVSLATAITFRSVFDRVESFNEAQRFFSKKIAELIEEFHDLKIISLNLSVLSANMGEQGLAMGKISAQFQTLAADINKHLLSFSDTIKTVSSDLKDCLLDIAFMKVQTDMVDFFVNESAAAGAGVDTGLAENSEIFSALCRDSNRTARKMLDRLEDRLGQIREASREVKKYINGLDVIEKMGAIEAGRANDIQSAMKGHLETLGSFNQMLRQAIREISSTEKDMSAKTHHLGQELELVAGSLDQIFSLAHEADLKKQEAARAAAERMA